MRKLILLQVLLHEHYVQRVKSCTGIFKTLNLLFQMILKQLHNEKIWFDASADN